MILLLSLFSSWRCLALEYFFRNCSWVGGQQQVVGRFQDGLGFYVCHLFFGLLNDCYRFGIALNYDVAIMHSERNIYLSFDHRKRFIDRSVLDVNGDKLRNIDDILAVKKIVTALFGE